MITNKDGNIWLVASDICRVLELDVSTSVNGRFRKDKDGARYKSGGLDEDEKGTVNVSTLGGTQKLLCVNESGLYSLVFGSSRPEAKAFRKWVTSEVIPSVRKNGSYTLPKKSKRVLQLEAAGKSPEFIEKRIETVTTRKNFTGVLKEHGVTGQGYQMCTRSTYQPLYGGDGSTSYIKEKLGIAKKASVRDSLPMVQLVAVQLSELLAAERIETQRANGNIECATVCLSSSQSVAQAVKESKRQLTA